MSEANVKQVEAQISEATVETTPKADVVIFS